MLNTLTQHALHRRQDTTWERPTLLPDGTVQFFPTEDWKLSVAQGKQLFSVHSLYSSSCGGVMFGGMALYDDISNFSLCGTATCIELLLQDSSPTGSLLRIRLLGSCAALDKIGCIWNPFWYPKQDRNFVSSPQIMWWVQNTAYSAVFTHEPSFHFQTCGTCEANCAGISMDMVAIAWFLVIWV